MPESAASSASNPPDAPAPLTAKIVIAGGFGVGKTTLVAALSEIPPLVTEEEMTAVSMTVDSIAGVEAKSKTTVALDFGRITLTEPQPLILLLFGTPGQERFRFSWNNLSSGAIGAIVLADTRRLDESFAAVTYFEKRSLPFVVAVNEFDHAHRYTPDEVRHALQLGDQVPVLMCDARNPKSAAGVLLALVARALTQAQLVHIPA